MPACTGGSHRLQLRLVVNALLRADVSASRSQQGTTMNRRATLGLSTMALLCLEVAIPGVAAAQTSGAKAQAPATGTLLVTLGTAGGPLPRKDRAQSSNLLVVNGKLYLIDAGGGVTRRIAQSGYDFRQVGKIFITHPHSDHTAGLATLLVSEWEQAPQEPIDVYGGGVERLVKGAIDYLTANAEIRWAEGKKTPMGNIFHGHDVAAGLIYQDANVKVSAVENTHFNFPRGSPPYGKYTTALRRGAEPSFSPAILVHRAR